MIICSSCVHVLKYCRHNTHLPRPRWRLLSSELKHEMIKRRFVVWFAGTSQTPKNSVLRFDETKKKQIKVDIIFPLPFKWTRRKVFYWLSYCIHYFTYCTFVIIMKPSLKRTNPSYDHHLQISLGYTWTMLQLLLHSYLCSGCCFTEASSIFIIIINNNTN